MGDEVQRGIAELGGIVRRDRGGHADRNALRAIGEQVGEGAGQNHRLLLLAGIIVAVVDRFLVDAFHQHLRNRRQPRLGVAVGGGTVAVDIAEIALALDQGIARGKILGEAHKGIVDRLVAMRVKIAHDIADDLRAFPEHGGGVKTQQVHAIEDAPVHRLQAIARIGQSAVHDGR